MDRNAVVEFLRNNWAVIFSGIGTAVVAGILGIWVSYLKRKRRSKTHDVPLSQSAKAGDNSQVVQGGRDVSVGDFIKQPNKKEGDI